jgi:hypothetical protein
VPEVIPERAQIDPKPAKDKRSRQRDERRRAAFLHKRLEQLPEGVRTRVRDLFRSLIGEMESDQITAAIEADTLKVAEMKVAAEELRAHLLAAEEPDAKLVTAVVRLEGAARRAAADLAAVAPKKQPKSWLERFQEGDNE